MARIFITGSSDGLGRMAAQLLMEQGHGVVLHARNEKRRREALSTVPGAKTVVIGDLTSISLNKNRKNSCRRLDKVCILKYSGKSSRPRQTDCMCWRRNASTRNRIDIASGAGISHGHGVDAGWVTE
jgi:NAD(P)-dependent dehydrogenase (short-subunit alcohol dehydrogenase family)